MPNKILNLIFKATDKASPTLDKLQGESGRSGIGGITSELKKLINPATLAMGAVASLGTAAVKTFENFRQYISDVSDFNSMINGTLEETSMLVRMMEDYGVSQDTMLAAMRTLAAQGYDPSIDSLISIRDKLAAATSESERLAMAQTLIGEQGIKQLLPMFREMGIELDNYKEDFDEALVVTLEMEEANIRLEKTLVDAKTEFEIIGLTVSSKVLPPLVSYLEMLTELFLIREMNISQFIEWRIEEKKNRDSLGASTEGIGENVRAYGRLQEAIGGVEGATEDLKEPTSYLGVALMIQKEGFTLAALAAWEEVAALIALKEAADNLAGGLEALAPLLSMSPGGSPWWNEIDLPSGGPGGGGGGGGGSRRVFDTRDPSKGGGWYTVTEAGWKRDEFATGGSFEVGGSGGGDRQRVEFMADPGEVVNISKEDSMAELLTLMRRMPTLIADAIERKL